MSRSGRVLLCLAFLGVVAGCGGPSTSDASTPTRPSPVGTDSSAPMAIGNAATALPAVSADCGKGAPQVQPRVIVLFCSDRSYVAQDLRWISWDNDSALANGKVHNASKGYRARLVLDQPVTIDARRVFTHVLVTYQPVGPQGLTTQAFYMPA